MSKKKNIFIISFIIIILLVLLVIFFINKNDNKNLNEITGFEYYSGSSSVAERFSGIRNGNIININFTEFNSGEQNVNKITITFNDFKELLNESKIENCKKHTYDYQCGEHYGCAYSSFSVSFENSDDNVCYEIDYNISDFFKNLTELYNEINYLTLSEEEKNSINLIELLEDIKSIKESDKIIEIENAKYNDNFAADESLYDGKGYTIKLIYNGDKTNCLINSKNGNKIWYVEK